VAGRPELLDAVRVRMPELANGYLGLPEFGNDIEAFLVALGLDGRSGVIGDARAGSEGIERGNMGLDD
jgi:hypothetical protein